jgi:hypothetical protein
MAVAATSDRPSLARAAGSLAVLRAETVVEVDRTTHAINTAKHVGIFPDSHLLNGPFAVPPNLFVKRWVLLNTNVAHDAPCIDWFVMTYEFEGGGFERVYLKYKERSERQRANCSSGRQD